MDALLRDLDFAFNYFICQTTTHMLLVTHRHSSRISHSRQRGRSSQANHRRVLLKIMSIRTFQHQCNKLVRSPIVLPLCFRRQTLTKCSSSRNLSHNQRLSSLGSRLKARAIAKHSHLSRWPDHKLLVRTMSPSTTLLTTPNALR